MDEFRLTFTSPVVPAPADLPPVLIGLDHYPYHLQLADLPRWTDTVLRQHHGGYELQDCWPRAIGGLSPRPPDGTAPRAGH